MWTKHSIRTLKKSGLCMFLSYMLFVCPWRCCSGANIQTHLGMQLSWIMFTMWASSFWVWFPPGDDTSFISSVLQLQALDKRHFLLVCVFSSTTKMVSVTKYTRLNTGYPILHGYVCACISMCMCTLSLK